MLFPSRRACVSGFLGGRSLSECSGEDRFESCPAEETLLTRRLRLAGLSPYVCASGFFCDGNVDVDAWLLLESGMCTCRADCCCCCDGGGSGVFAREGSEEDGMGERGSPRSSRPASTTGTTGGVVRADDGDDGCDFAGDPWDECLAPLSTEKDAGRSGRGDAKGRAGTALGELDGSARSAAPRRTAARSSTSSSTPGDNGDGGDLGELGVIVFDEDEDTFENDMNGALGGDSNETGECD